MKKKVEEHVYKASNVIEFLMSVLIIIVVIIFGIDLIRFTAIEIISNPTDGVFTDFLEKALNLLIGIEFVRMLCNHNPATVIEVLLFAIARQMIVTHLEITQIFVGVVSIAILFATHKFLSVRKNE
ncbi:MAG: phosphate-starvation-inducible PsiE family protein [bacterium]|nr:phosphate-starvation-inducible PsiE family protein [bacterium]